MEQVILRCPSPPSMLLLKMVSGFYTLPARGVWFGAACLQFNMCVCVCRRVRLCVVLLYLRCGVVGCMRCPWVGECAFMQSRRCGTYVCAGVRAHVSVPVCLVCPVWSGLAGCLSVCLVCPSGVGVCVCRVHVSAGIIVCLCACVFWQCARVNGYDCLLVIVCVCGVHVPAGILV